MEAGSSKSTSSSGAPPTIHRVGQSVKPTEHDTKTTREHGWIHGVTSLSNTFKNHKSSFRLYIFKISTRPESSLGSQK